MNVNKKINLTNTGISGELDLSALYMKGGIINISNNPSLRTVTLPDTWRFYQKAWWHLKKGFRYL